MSWGGAQGTHKGWGSARASSGGRGVARPARGVGGADLGHGFFPRTNGDEMEPVRDWPLRERVFSFAVLGALTGGVFGAVRVGAAQEGARLVLVYLIVLGLGSGALIGGILLRLDRMWKLGMTGGAIGACLYGGMAVLSGLGVAWGLIWTGVIVGSLAGLAVGWRFRGWRAQE